MKEAIRRLKEEEIARRALNIVKYQNFSTKVALAKMDTKVPRVVFESGVSYLKKGKRDHAISEKLKIELDKCVANCVQPLKPSHDEQRRFLKTIYQTKEAKPPICNLPVLKQKLSTVFDYGVQVGDCIKICKDEAEARAFLEGVNFMNKDSKGVLIEVEKRIVQ